jgi:hypothetical protein
MYIRSVRYLRLSGYIADVIPSVKHRDTFLKYRTDKKYFVIYYRGDSFFRAILYRTD